MPHSFSIKPMVSLKALVGEKLATRLITGALISSLFVLPMGFGVTRAQTSNSLSTQIAVGDQPQDLTIFDSPDGLYSFHRTVVGDFDGDGVDDLLVTNHTASTRRNQSCEAYAV